ncbi:hypothetical protein [Thermococcus eurythermalis]|nr:hypothetical protein [Thermococcus eurythermalis]
MSRTTSRAIPSSKVMSAVHASTTIPAEPESRAVSLRFLQRA